ncbi:MAG TPA: hypothetical protein VFO08_02250 [Methylomirabilota bacterium]|jgi:hypothetical protein|nr:hypothetical protein [Methylomirabilota bacterium]
MAGPDLSSIITSAVTPKVLRPRNDLREPGWAFWELRTLNMHRVVGLLQHYRQFADAHDFESTIRGAAARNFKCSWWRGMGLGVVAQAATIPLSVDDLKVLVDVRENSKGTLQWVILVTSDTHSALGVHTWMETYLSPVYRSTLQGLAEAGCRVSSVTRNKDGLMKLLTGVADLEAALLSLGTRKQAFPEFRDDLRR